jgi:hypothetical protein
MSIDQQTTDQGETKDPPPLTIPDSQFLIL